MTVNELRALLDELADRGRGTWEVKVYAADLIQGQAVMANLPINDVFTEDEKREVVID
jgi:hypothetical protein